MEREKATNSQSNVEKETKAGGITIPDFSSLELQTAIAESCNHQDSMALAHKQTHRPME